MLRGFIANGAPERIRTSDPQMRRRDLMRCGGPKAFTTSVRVHERQRNGAEALFERPCTGVNQRGRTCGEEAVTTGCNTWSKVGGLACRGFGNPGSVHCAFFEVFDLPELLNATASRTSALKANSSTSPPSWMSIARRTVSSNSVKRQAGSFRDAPLAKVSFTTFLSDSPVQMMPS